MSFIRSGYFSSFRRTLPRVLSPFPSSFFHSTTITFSQRFSMETQQSSELFRIITTSSNPGFTKPDTDDREYRIIKLNNGLEAVLIHDENTDKASAALSVNVGSFADPPDLQGLAHFCEHLLFMGTEKFPSENEYSEYLSAHSGHSNAYTAPEETNYFFEVGKDHFEGALDRFAQFFINPLFSPDCKDREIRAVDSENKKNLQSDNWRLHQLDRSLSNPEHPYNNFSTGNLETLGTEPLAKGLDVREELLKFYKSHYSANLMKLVMLGKEDLDTLQSWAVEYFSPIRNNNLSRPNYNKPIFTEDHLLKFIKAEPVMDTRSLDITFLMPDQSEHWDVKPSSYYSHLLGHEGGGSVLFYLKELGYAESLSTSGYHVSAGNDFFSVNIGLTEEGLKHYKEVTKIVFEYIALLKQSSVQEYVYKELQETALMDFKFQQKTGASRTTSKLSSLLNNKSPNFPRDFILSPGLFRNFDKQVIEEYGEHLRPENFRITLVAQSLDNLTETEKWYGVKYSIEDIEKGWFKELTEAKPNEKLHLPTPNEFIATNFTVPEKIPGTVPAKKPKLIKNSSNLKVWFKPDDQFFVPKGTMYIRLGSPTVNTTPTISCIATLYTQLLEDSLNDIAYNAEIAGLEYSLYLVKDGLELALSGYNDKMHKLLNVILQRMATFTPDEKRFNILKNRLQRSYKNFGYSIPYNQIGHYTLYLLNERTWTVEEKLSALDSLTFESFKRYMPLLLYEFDVEMLAHGNFTKEDALQVSDMVMEKLNPVVSAHGTSTKNVPTRSYLLKPGDRFRYDVTLADKENKNSCIEYFIQVGSITDDRLRALLDLLAQIGHEPSFNKLRTKEQLGYVVFSGVRQTRTTIGYRVLIQSERPTAYLEHRIDAFLGTLRQILEKLTDKEFNDHLEALKHKKLEKKKNLKEETDRYWAHIRSGYYNFLRHEIDVKFLDTLTKKDVLDFFNKYIDTSTGRQTRLVVNLNSQVEYNPSRTKTIKSVLSNYLIERDISFSSSDLDASVDSLQLDSSKYSSLSQDELDQIIIAEMYPKIESKMKEIAGDTDLSGFKQFFLDSLLSETPASYPGGEPVKDITQFRNSLVLTEAPNPVVDLSTFMDNEAKL